MSEVKNIPRLRFESFDRSYSEVRLSSLLKRYSQKNSDEEFKIDDILSLSSTHGIVDRKELLDNTYENVNHFAYVKTRVNDFVYGKSITKENPYGLFRANLLRDGLLSTLYFTFKVSDSVIPKFLEYYFGHTNRANNYLKKFVLVGDRYLNADANYILSGKISIPSLPEQQKIADFLTAVDKRIELLEKKKTLLETYKKGVMKKIFPSTSSGKNPEIRFKDDNGINFPNWEEKRLGEISNITIGEFVIKTKQNPESEYPVYNGGKSWTGFYDDYNNEGNKILISARGANAGFVNFEKKRFWAGNSCYSIDMIDHTKYKIEYFFFYIKCFENRFTDYQQAANIPSVSKKDVTVFKVSFPSYKEQDKIHRFLENIDTQIKLLRTQIEKSKTWKKGLLQKMFV